MFSPIHPGQILKPQDTIIVAVSGGADSMALLHWLWANYSYKLIVAHLNHGLRKEAKAEEALVAKVAKKYGAKFVSSTQSVKEYAKKQHIGIEEAGRTLRYLFLHRVRRDYRAKTVITAHHLDDHIETALMNLLRGCSTSGLTGIEALNFYPTIYAKNRTLLFRPLLTVSKEEIQKYVKKHKLAFINDPSNDDITFTRNRIRKEVMPKLKEINPSFLHTMQRNLMINADISDYLIGQANKWRLEVENGFAAYDFNQLHIALRREVLRQIYKDLYGHLKNVSAMMIEDIIELILDAKTGKKKAFGSAWQVEIEYGKVYLRRAQADVRFVNDIFALNPDGETKFKTSKVVIKEVKNKKTLKGDDLYSAYLDADAVKGKQLFVRFWQPGDRFHPKGMTGTKKLQDFFTDKKISKKFRKHIPLIVTGDNEIVWVVGLRISEDFCMKPESKKMIHVQVVSGE